MRFHSSLLLTRNPGNESYLTGESIATAEEIGRLASLVAFIYQNADFEDDSPDKALPLYFSAEAELFNLEDAARADVTLSIQRGNMQYPSFDIWCRQKFEQDIGQFYLVNDTHYAFSSKSQRSPRYEWKITQDIYQATDDDERYFHGQRGRYYVDSPERFYNYLCPENDERQVAALNDLTGQERLSRDRCDRLLDILKRMDIQVLRPEQTEDPADVT